jgi:fibronectin-binding autotransporter adhesin
MKAKRSNPLFAHFFRGNNLAAAVVVTLTGFAAVASSNAQSISVNFGANHAASSITEALKTAGAIPIAGNRWNNTTVNGGGTLGSLIDSTGATTGTSVTWTAGNTYFSGSTGATLTSENGDLTKGYLDDSGTGWTVNMVSPYLLNNIYAIHATDQGNPAGISAVSMNGVFHKGNGTVTIPANGSGDSWSATNWTNADTLIESANYIRVTNQPQVSLAGLNGSPGRAAIGGLQIENAYAGTLAYWDLDGPTPGASGDTAPIGVWNSSNTTWSSSAAGDVATAAWTAGNAAVFSAGTTATGTYTVLVQGSQSTDGVWARNGTVTLGDGGLGAQISLTGPGVLRGDTGLTVAIPVTGTNLTTGGVLALNNSANSITGLASIFGTTTLGANQSFGSLAGGGTLALGTRTLSVGSDSTASSFGGLLTGTGAITKSGTGRLTLLNNNTGFTGTTTISAGVLRLGNGGNTGAISGTVNGTGTVEVLRNDSSVIATAFTGAGAINFLGTGVINQSQYDFSGATSAFTGTVSIDDSRLRIDAADLTNASPITVLDGGQAWMQGGTNPKSYLLNGIGWTESAGQLGAMRFENGAIVSGSVTVSTPSRIVAYGTTGTISGALLGSANLEINIAANAAANGTVNLTNAGGYTGTLTLSRGTLNAGALGGGLNVNANSTANITGAIAGTTTLTAGILTLNNGASIGSPTVIAGALNVNVGSNVTGAIVMPSGTTLGLGGGSIAGDLTLGAVGTDTHTLNFSATMAVPANLTASGTQTVNLINQPAVGGTITLFTYSGAGNDPIDGNLQNNFVLGGVGTSTRAAGTFVDTGSSITLAIDNRSLTWAGTDGTNPTFWNAGSTSAVNWTGGDTRFYNGDAVTFDDTATGLTVAMQSLLIPSAVTFNNTTKNFTVTGGAGTGITGSTGVTKSGTGTVTLGGAGSNFTGPVLINGGLLNFNNGEALGFNSGVTINSGGAVNFNGHAPANQGRHYTYTIAGQGTDGAGGLGSLYTTGGDIFANAGIRNLVLSADAEIGGNNGRFDLGLSGGVAGTITGGGFTLTKVGSNKIVVRPSAATAVTYVVNAGSLTFEDFNAASGTNLITVNAGTLGTYGPRTLPNDVNFTAAGAQLVSEFDTGTWNGAINLGGNTTLQAGGNLVIGGSLAGTGNITKTGGGALVLQNSAPSYSGKITATAGTLRIASSGALGTATGADVLSLGGNTLQGGTIAGLASLTLGATQGITQTGNVTYDAGTGTTLEIAGNITGTGNLTKAGAGTLTLSGASSLPGSMSIGAGATNVTGSLAATGAANAVTLSGGASLNVSGSFSAANYLYVASGTLNITAGTVSAVNFRTTENGSPSVVNHSAGTFNVTGSTIENERGNSFMFNHWGGSSTYNLSGSSVLNVLNTNVNMGWDGNAYFNQSGGTANLRGINMASGRNNAGSYTLTGGRLNLGLGGITSASAKTVSLGAGTVGAFADWTGVSAMVLTDATTGVTFDTLDSVGGVTPRTITLTGALSGIGGLVKTGAGTLVLSSSNTYNGPTAINGGKLHLGTTSASTVSVNPGGTLQPGSISAPAFTTVPGLTLNGGTAAFRANFTAGDKLVVSGTDTFTVPAATAISVFPAGDLQPDDRITLIDYTGADLSPAAFANLTLAASSNPHITWELENDTADTQVDLHIIDADTITWTGDAGGTWDVNTTTSWVLDSDDITPSNYYDYDAVTLDDTGIDTPNVTLVGSILPSLVTVDNTSGTYVLSGNGIGGSASLVKTGGGNLTLHNDNTRTGATTISGGTVTVGNGGTIGTLGGTGNITLSSATLAFDRSDAQTLSRVVSGTGGILVKNGTNTLTMSAGGNTCDIVINTGTLNARGGGFSAAFAAGKTISVTGTAILDTVTHSMGSVVGGGGEVPLVVLTNGGTWRANNEQYIRNLTMTAGNVIGAGELRSLGGSVYTTNAAATSTTIAAGINLVSNLTFAVNDGAVTNDLVITGYISNASTLTKTGAGTMVPSGNNTYTGGTNANGGVIEISSIADAGGVGSIGVFTTGGTGYLGIANDGTFRYTGTGVQTTARNLWIDTGTETKTIEVVSATGDITFSGTAGNINKPFTKTGAGALTIADVMNVGTAVTVNGGKLTLGGTNVYTGDTTVNASGTLVVDGDSIDNTGKLLINGSGKVQVTELVDPVVEIVDTLFIDGVQMAAGTYGATGSGAGTIDNTHFAGAGVVEVITGPTTGYETWAAQITNGEVLRGEDADDDGFTNLQEFLFGTDPMANTASLSTFERSGADLIIRWNELAAGATYRLLESATLANPWTESSEIPFSEGAEVDGYIPRRADITIGAGKNFFRVEGVETAP